MKHLGNSPDGGVIVEMNPMELKAFKRLHAACTGKSFSFDDFTPCSEFMNMDLSHPLEMVSAFALTRFRLTELEQSVDMFKQALENKGV